LVNSYPVLIMKNNKQKKENCAHAFISYMTKKYGFKGKYYCNIGDINKCETCKKFYHHDWLKSDMEITNHDK